MNNYSITFQQFAEELLEEVKGLLGSCYEVSLERAVKNNSTYLDGIMIKKQGCKIAPNFYLDECYRRYQYFGDMPTIAREIVEAYERSRHQHINFDMEHFAEAMNNVYFKLVNTEMNKEMLANVPHRPFLDLSIVYYITVPIDKGTTGTLIITNEHMNMFLLAEEDLYARAMENTQLDFKGTLKCMEDVLYDLSRKLDIPMEQSYDMLPPMMLVATNEKGMFGSSVLLYKNFLKEKLSRFGRSKYVILPSSVHETILLPLTKDYCQEYFSNMVKEINKTQVEPTEILSNTIYLYDLETDTISISVA